MGTFDDTQQSKKIAEIKHKEEESFVERVAERFKLPYINLLSVTIETDALVLVPEKEAREALLAPFKIVGTDLYIGVKSPNLPQTKKVLDRLGEKYTLGVHMVSTRSLDKAWERYADISYAENTQGGMLDISQTEVQNIAQSIKTNADITQRFEAVMSTNSSQKTTQIMEVIFGAAIATNSSDVHIEAQESQVRLRFRQDGVLQDITTFDYELYKKVLSRIKLLSEMKLTQNDSAQDGRFTIDFDDKQIEVRVSVIPSAYGESFVMRILNPDGIRVGLEQLGIEPKLYEILLKEIQKPNGMILTTGPTGSGKTTTLYSFLRKVYNPEVKILTIEDPIEYHLEGISQTQINRAKNYTFLNGLRAALRQDPDIVMVGEIRDSETATIAVNASLTGHLVLSTLHTNDAAGVIPRLVDLGINPQILSAALSVSLAQRLVRKVCEHCKEQVAPTAFQEQTIRDILQEADANNKPLHEYKVSKDQKIMLTQGRGCDACNHTGYKGRIGIFEAIITDELVKELLNHEPSEQEVRRVAEKQGLLNMREDGVIKILNGVTSFDEVRSVVDLDIRNITQLDDQGATTEKKSSAQLIHTQEKVSPDALMNPQSVEISLLLDYVRVLEQEQKLNPDTDASEKIKLIQHTILDLLKHNQAEKIFDQEEHIDTHNHFTQITDDLEKLYHEQQRTPNLDISHKIQNIREDIEHYKKA